MFQSIQRSIILYVYPIFLGLGLLGCVLNMVIFTRGKLRKSSCSICEKIFFRQSWKNPEKEFVFFSKDFFAASVDHICTLIIGIVPLLYSLDHPNPINELFWFCKVRSYFFQISLMASRWFVAFACVDRFASSSDAARFRNFVTKRNTRRAIVVIILFWTTVCVHRLIFYEISSGFCSISNHFTAALYHSLYVTIGGGFLPALIMIVCAILIRRNLIEKHQRRLQMSIANRNGGTNVVDNQVQKILFIQVIFYLIFTMPQLCNLMYITVTINIDENGTSQTKMLFNFLAETMLYLFPVTSFYLYTLTSRTFRSELIKISGFRFGNSSNLTAPTANVQTTNQRF